MLLILLIGGGVWLFLSPKEAEKTVSSVKNESVADSFESATPEVVPEKPSMAQSIKEAMGVGSPMLCTYSFGAGPETMSSRVYVSGKKFKAETMAGGIKTQILSDGDMQYVWTSGSAQGMKMSQNCLESLKAAIPESGQTTPSAPQDYQQSFDGAENVQCEPATGAGTEFSVPTDVVFTDQCAMMEQSKKMMEQYQNKIPADISRSMPVQY